jgi:hypothetical protein
MSCTQQTVTHDDIKGDDGTIDILSHDTEESLR